MELLGPALGGERGDRWRAGPADPGAPCCRWLASSDGLDWPTFATSQNLLTRSGRTRWWLVNMQLSVPSSMRSWRVRRSPCHASMPMRLRRMFRAGCSGPVVLAGCSGPVVLSQLCFTTSAIALPRRVADVITSDFAHEFCEACCAGQIQRSNNRSQAKVETVDRPRHRGNNRLSHGKLIGRHNLPQAVERRFRDSQQRQWQLPPGEGQL